MLQSFQSLFFFNVVVSLRLDLPVTKPEAAFSLEMPEVEFELHYLLTTRKWIPKPYLKSMSFK